jgi:WD40 repeat protein
VDEGGRLFAVEPGGNAIAHPDSVVGMARWNDLLLTVSVYPQAVPGVPAAGGAGGNPARRRTMPVSQLTLVNWTTGEIQQQETYVEGRIGSVDFWQGGERVLLVDDKNRIVDWELGQSLPRPIELAERVTSTVWAAIRAGDDRRLLTVGSRFARLWSVPRTGQDRYELLMEFGPHSTIQTVSMSASPGEQLIATGDHSGQVKIWDAARRQVLQRLKTEHNGPIVATRFVPTTEDDASPDERLLTAGGTNLMIWKRGAEWVPLLDQPVELRQWVSQLTFVDFSPDGRCVITCDESGRADLWDFAQLEQGITVRKGSFQHENAISCAVFSRDGKLIVTGGEDRESKGYVWWNVDSEDWIKVGRIAGHPTGITCLAISEDDTRLLSGSRDKTIKLWDLSPFRFDSQTDSTLSPRPDSPEDRLPHQHLSLVELRETLTSLIELSRTPAARNRLQSLIDSKGFTERFNPHPLLTPLKQIREADQLTAVLEAIRGSDDEIEPLADRPESAPPSLKQLELKLLDQLAKQQADIQIESGVKAPVEPSPSTPRPEEATLTQADLDQIANNLSRLRLLIDEPLLIEEILTLSGHARAVTSVSFAPAIEVGGKRIHTEILSSSVDGTVLRWPAPPEFTPDRLTITSSTATR